MGFNPREPHQLAHRDWTVLLCHADASIRSDHGCGLYDNDCRILSEYRLTLSAGPLEPSNSCAIESDEWVAESRVLRQGPGPDGPRLPQDALEVRVERLIGRGMVETITVFNHSMEAASTRLSLDIGGDFADVLEIAQRRRQQNGVTRISARAKEVRLRYSATNGEHRTERGLRVRVLGGDVQLSAEDELVKAEAAIDLAPRGRWRATLAFEPLRDGRWATALQLTAAWQRDGRERQRWRSRRPSLETTNATLATAWRIAADDIYALRNRDLEDIAGEGWVVNAGVPIFTGLFGRDVLTAAWQSAILGADLFRGALALNARLQATDDDAWRDSEPGKLIHEFRRGPLADLRITAQSGYYGTQTTAAMFPLALSELWHWAGDDAPLRRYRPTIERALEWARTSGDPDHDGFLEYRQRSPVGIKNQGWKDSHEAIRYADGSLVENPIATVEEQAFHFLALCRMAEMCVVLDDDAAAETYLARARRLRDRFDADYWMPDEGFYAMALGPDKEQVTSIGSNAGHALAAGLVPPERAGAVVERLMAADMFTGWGVRTLSTKHPSFNPWAYHLGTVWPVENATFALGFKRYGFDAQTDMLVAAMIEATRWLPGNRLPELIGGQARSDVAYPVAYPDANAPQAWSASATLQLAQIMLGMYPFAALNVLALVRPRLPEGIDDLTLRNLRVGKARVSVRFERRPDGSASHKVIARRGPLLLVEAPPPDAAGPFSVRESIANVALANAPGRLARAGRIALGMID